MVKKFLVSFFLVGTFLCQEAAGNPQTLRRGLYVEANLEGAPGKTVVAQLLNKEEAAEFISRTRPLLLEFKETLSSIAPDDERLPRFKQFELIDKSELSSAVSTFRACVTQDYTEGNRELLVVFITWRAIESPEDLKGLTAKDIEACLSVSTRVRCKVVKHMGIYRNLEYLVAAFDDPSIPQPTPKVSLVLHAAAARLMLLHDPSKRWMVTCPMGPMIPILVRSKLPVYVECTDDFLSSYAETYCRSKDPHRLPDEDLELFWKRLPPILRTEICTKCGISEEESQRPDFPWQKEGDMFRLHVGEEDVHCDLRDPAFSWLKNCPGLDSPGWGHPRVAIKLHDLANSLAPHEDPAAEAGGGGAAAAP